MTYAESIPLPLTAVLDSGVDLSAWDSIDCDSDLFTPADALRLVGPSDQDGVPVAWPQLQRASRLVVTLGSSPVFSGHLVQVTNEVGEARDEVVLEAADAAKRLVDCPPVKAIRRPAGSLSSIAGEIGAGMGLPVVVNADLPRATALTFGKTETAWAILETLAREAGAWLWVDAAGSLCVENLAPYYAAPPVAKLVCAPVGPGAGGNNLMEFTLRNDFGERFSPVVVRGGGGGDLFGDGGATCEGIAVDPDLAARGIVRPKVIDDPDCKTIAQAMAKAAREVAIRRVEGTKIECTVDGFLAPGATPVPWQTTQMVAVSIPDKGVVGRFFVAGRRFLMDAQNGYRTKLTLIEPDQL